MKNHDRGLKNVDKEEEPLTFMKAEMKQENRVTNSLYIRICNKLRIGDPTAGIAHALLKLASYLGTHCNYI